MGRESDPHLIEKTRKELRRLEASALSGVNRDALEIAIKWKPGFEPKPEIKKTPIPVEVTMEDPHFLRRVSDELSWDYFQNFIPGGAHYKAAFISLCDAMVEEKNPEMKCKMGLTLKDMIKEIVKGILQVKAKQSEKPSQTLNVVKVDRGGLGINDSVEAPKKRKAHTWTPEMRAAQAERIRARNAARHAARKAASSLPAPEPATTVPSAQAEPSST